MSTRRRGAGRILVRLASVGDLRFVHRDKEIPVRVMRRMIREGDVFVAEVAGQRVGLARLEYLWGKTPLLTSLWVEPESRRHGVATALLDHVSRRLHRRGEVCLYSSTVPENKPGLAWHRALGFERIGFINKINPDGGGEVFYRRRLPTRGTGGSTI
jgi:ribosomal protein S18 acetylase RimI-like enzyme